jgi:hypothetical protein
MSDRPGPSVLHLRDLCEPHPDRPVWSVTFGAACADASAVCLDSQNHAQPVLFQIDGIPSTEVLTEVLIVWDAVDDTIRRFNADLEVATEYGAYGIAALIMPELTGLTVIERSVKNKGLGFDFWLGSIDDPGGLFQRKARLEVSGIRRGSESIVKSRVRMKLEQIAPSDALAPGYVCVIEFGTPRVWITEK